MSAPGNALLHPSNLSAEMLYGIGAGCAVGSFQIKYRLFYLGIFVFISHELETRHANVGGQVINGCRGQYDKLKP